MLRNADHEVKASAQWWVPLRILLAYELGFICALLITPCKSPAFSHFDCLYLLWAGIPFYSVCVVPMRINWGFHIFLQKESNKHISAWFLRVNLPSLHFRPPKLQTVISIRLWDANITGSRKPACGSSFHLICVFFFLMVPSVVSIVTTSFLRLISFHWWGDKNAVIPVAGKTRHL